MWLAGREFSLCPFGSLLCSYFPLVKGEQEGRGAGLGPRKTPEPFSFLLPPPPPPNSELCSQDCRDPSSSRVFQACLFQFFLKHQCLLCYFGKSFHNASVKDYHPKKRRIFVKATGSNKVGWKTPGLCLSFFTCKIAIMPPISQGDCEPWVK